MSRQLISFIYTLGHEIWFKAKLNIEYVRQMQALIASSVFERTGMLVRFQIGRKKKKKKKKSSPSKAASSFVTLRLSFRRIFR